MPFRILTATEAVADDRRPRSDLSFRSAFSRPLTSVALFCGTEIQPEMPGSNPRTNREDARCVGQRRCEGLPDKPSRSQCVGGLQRAQLPRKGCRQVDHRCPSSCTPSSVPGGWKEVTQPFPGRDFQVRRDRTDRDHSSRPKRTLMTVVTMEDEVGRFRRRIVRLGMCRS